MSKILGFWSAMRRYLEQDMIADSLKGRIRYSCTTYVGMDGCYIFEIRVDGKQIKRFSWETIMTYFIENGYTKIKDPRGIREYWDGFSELKEKYSINDRTEYTDDEFCKALEKYRTQDIRTSIKSSDPLVRMFAILDGRLGKRTLTKLKDETDYLPEWLKNLYKLRFEAEQI
ncbi:MAG: hypothetical protein E7573_07720 [Ruminococcaceae bacterium]|nr:hypothetical protein [Oscillospiraceae bacterium]